MICRLFYNLDQWRCSLGILAWLKRITLDGDIDDLDQPIHFEKGDEKFNGLNMKQALDAHLEWTRRFESMMKGEQVEKVKYNEVACDDACMLGKWIHGYAKQAYSTLPEYKELKNAHANFHLTAGNVVKHIDNADVLQAKEQLKAMRVYSGRVQLTLARLYAATQ